VDEFDPDTINNIQISDPTVKKVSKTIDINFRFDGLKAIYSDGKTATLLTKNNGYDNNDIYSVNLESGVFKNLTNNGFVREVKKVDSNYLYLTKEGENPGVVNVLLGNGSKKELIASESLNLFTLNKNNLVTIDKKNNLVVSDLEKGSESISAMSLGESIGEINYLLAEDCNIIIFSSAGIFKVNI
jgi:S-adenosylhomocysteine hydrolase